MKKEQDNNSNFKLDEVISPIFGCDYKNRIIPKNNEKKTNAKNFNYLEQHVKMELLQEHKLNKNKEYQTKANTSFDVLKQYQEKQKKQDIIKTLPSQYLDFRDNLLKNSNELTIINDFSDNTNTISQIIKDIFNNEEDKNKD